MPSPYQINRLVTVFGGSGFIGRYAVQVLARAGYRIRVAVRRPDLALYLQPLGTVGQIMPIQANLRYRWSIDRAVEGADAVVNLVGILAERGRQSFQAVQAEGAGHVAEAAAAAGASALAHVSAIGADASSDIAYLRTKGEAERRVLAAFPGAVIFRPSIVFGPEDQFFNRFAAMARLSPILPVIGAQTRFQPVYAGDVGEAIGKAVMGEAQPGTVYELGGPHVLTFRECMERMLKVIARRRPIIGIPFGLARGLARLTEVLPGPPLTRDQVRMLERDTVVSQAAIAEGRTLEGLGIDSHSVDVILPTYLTRFREHGQFTPPGTREAA